MADLSGRLFDYPSTPRSHRHGPHGYKNYEDYKAWLRDEFTFTYVYCLVRERWQRGGHRHFSVDHLIPQSVAPDQVNNYSNLLYACVDCNSLRQDRQVLNPLSVSFAHHLRVMGTGTINGLTPDGKAHIQVLQLASQELTDYRKQIIKTVKLIEDSNELDALNLLRYWIGFPQDLPNLLAKRPPGGNTSPNAAKNCYFQQHQQGKLPHYY